MGPKFNVGDFILVQHIDIFDGTNISHVVILKQILLDLETNDYLYQFYSFESEEIGKHSLVNDRFNTFTRMKTNDYPQ